MTRFRGYAALFDRADRAGDIFRRGAFASAPACVPLLAQHRGPPVGQAEVVEDERGLRVTGVLNGDAGGVIEGQGLSVGYRPVTVRRGARRELLAVTLVEVSLVAQPMQPLARVACVDAPIPSDGAAS